MKTMSDRTEQEEDLYFELLSRTDPAERTDFLDQTCAGKPVLRARMEKILALSQQADKFFAKAELAISFLLMETE